jgi:phage protein D
MANQGIAGARVLLNGTVQDPQAMALVTVDLDVDQPDMCCARLSNTNDTKYTRSVKQGDLVEIKIGNTEQDVQTVFKGEVVGLDPLWDVGGATSVNIVAFNKLHRLTRARKSKTFEKQTDHQIAQKIAQDHGLTPDISGDVAIQHLHMYQHHQTDFEFLRERCSRIGYELLCDNEKLYFRQRKLDQGNELTLVFGRDKVGETEVALERFSARLNSANQLKKVNVRSWNPGQSTEIVGQADSLIKVLGAKQGSEAAGTFGAADASFELPVVSKEEADAAAKSLLEDFSLNYITGEGLCKGDPRLTCGIVVEIKVDEDAQDERFNGKYYVTGVQHRYTHKSGSSGTGGYQTIVRVRRNAEGT